MFLHFADMRLSARVCIHLAPSDFIQHLLRAAMLFQCIFVFEQMTIQTDAPTHSEIITEELLLCFILAGRRS